VQTNLLSFNCSFGVLYMFSAVTSGLNRELLTPMSGCLRGLTLLTAISAGGVLVAAFLLYVTVLNRQDPVAL
jgi:hypothetical protein